jgi:hypothetical protein
MTTVYTPQVALNTNDANNNTNFRTFVQLGANSNGQIRVTFSASTTTNLTLVGASFGKWDGLALSSVAGDMTTPAFRLTFSSANGATVPSGTTLASDFITHTGLALSAGDWLIVAWDNSSPAGELLSTGNTTATTMFVANNTDFSQAQTVSSTGVGWSVIGQPGTSSTNYVISLVETNSPPPPPPDVIGLAECEW